MNNQLTDVLVTGGSGFIGRVVIEQLQASGRFRHIVNLDPVPGPGVHLDVDIRQPIDAGLLDGYNFSHCIHLAAVAKEPGYPEHEYYLTNTTGTENVLALCETLGIGHVVFTSTMMVFAPTDDAKVEDDIPNPNTAYGASKHQAEQALLDFGRRTGAITVCLRPGVVFGPGDKGNFERLRALLSRKAFFYCGRSDTIKSCIHVDDVAGFTVHCLGVSVSRPAIHLAFPEPTTLREITEAIQRSFGYSGRIRTLPYRLLWLASWPFELLAKVGLESGIHHRRIEKLNQSTNISTKAFDSSSYEMCHRTVDDAIEAWARADAKPERSSVRETLR